MHLLSFGPVSTSCSWTLTLLNDVTDIHFGVDPCGQICISSPCVNVSPFLSEQGAYELRTSHVFAYLACSGSLRTWYSTALAVLLIGSLCELCSWPTLQ